MTATRIDPLKAGTEKLNKELHLNPAFESLKNVGWIIRNDTSLYQTSSVQLFSDLCRNVTVKGELFKQSKEYQDYLLTPQNDTDQVKAAKDFLNRVLFHSTQENSKVDKLNEFWHQDIFAQMRQALLVGSGDWINSCEFIKDIDLTETGEICVNTQIFHLKRSSIANDSEVKNIQGTSSTQFVLKDNGLLFDNFTASNSVLYNLLIKDNLSLTDVEEENVLEEELAYFAEGLSKSNNKDQKKQAEVIFNFINELLTKRNSFPNEDRLLLYDLIVLVRKLLEDPLDKNHLSALKIVLYGKPFSSLRDGLITKPWANELNICLQSFVDVIKLMGNPNQNQLAFDSLQQNPAQALTTVSTVPPDINRIDKSNDTKQESFFSRHKETFKTAGRILGVALLGSIVLLGVGASIYFTGGASIPFIIGIGAKVGLPLGFAKGLSTASASAALTGIIAGTATMAAGAVYLMKKTIDVFRKPFRNNQEKRRRAESLKDENGSNAEQTYKIKGHVTFDNDSNKSYPIYGPTNNGNTSLSTSTIIKTVKEKTKEEAVITMKVTYDKDNNNNLNHTREDVSYITKISPTNAPPISPTAITEQPSLPNPKKDPN